MAQADICVHNARVVTPSGTTDGGVAATDGRIVAVGADANLPAADWEGDDCLATPPSDNSIENNVLVNR